MRIVYVLNVSPIEPLEQFSRRSSYFRGKKIRGEFDIRLEQAEFQELTVSARSNQGVTVTVRGDRAGIRPLRLVLTEGSTWDIIYYVPA